MTAAILAAVLLVAPGPDSILVRAESLLVRGDLNAARAIVERVLRDRPEDPAALILLGRVHLAWPTIGRYRAWRLFHQAARSAPDDPEPRYWQVEVGLYLGGDDGERMARDAIFRILAITPDYRNIWEVWDRFYHSADHRRRALRLLERFQDRHSALRRAQLLIELDQPADADTVLVALAAAGHDDAALWALRAQAAFDRGAPASGTRYYASAIERAASDSLGILWRQIAALTAPEEEAAYHVSTPAERSAYYEAFWARREPDLTTRDNERIAEHFRRLRTARTDFKILHPQTLFHRSALWRTLNGARAPEVLSRLGDFHLSNDVIPGRSVLEDEVQRAGLGVDVRDLPEPDSITRYARFGLDGRGLMYLRYGEPDERLITVGPGVDVEAWRYTVDGRVVSITFARATAGHVGGGGDFVLFPTNRRELHNGTIMLERDQTGIEADLPVDSWVAAFRAADVSAAAAGMQDVYVATSTDTAGAALWTRDGREVARAVGASPLRLEVPDGHFDFGVDARADGRLGRIRGSVTIPPLNRGWLALSSLLVAVVDDSLPDRETMARATPADLVVVRHGRPLTLYTEIYDLPSDAGVARYDVEYAFHGIDDRLPAAVFSFSRAAAATSVVRERLVVQPGQVPDGAYRITLTIRDRTLGLEAQTVRINVTLR